MARGRTIGLLVGLLTFVTALAQGSVQNGDFEQGAVAFTSGLSYQATGFLVSGQYSIRTSAVTANPQWCQTDHTSGSGNFMVCDGFSFTTSAWRQTATVCPGETYMFSAWLNNLVCTSNFADPLIELLVDGNLVAGPLSLPETPNAWVEISGSFTANSDSVLLEIYALSSGSIGNDFGIDDVSLKSIEQATPGWSALDTGCAGVVWDLAVFDEPGPGGPALYAGGLFPFAGPLAANGIARWDGQAWSTLASSGITEGTIYALTTANVNGTGTALYAGGFLTGIGGVAAKGVAKWDGTTWSALGGGIVPGASVQALQSFTSGGTESLYAGGFFSVAGGVPANNVARWNGTTWTALGSGVNGGLYSLAVFDDGSGPALYVGGFFSTAGGAPANNIARWNGSSWSALGSGVNSTVYALTVMGPSGGNGPRLIAAGSFTTAGGVSANRVAAWNGTSWSPLGSGIDSSVRALAVSHDGTNNAAALYAGGQFYNAGGQSTTRVARWDGTSWSALGGGINPGVFANLGVYSLGEFDAHDGAGPALFVGGEYTAAGQLAARSIARWGIPSPQEVRFDGLRNTGLGATQLTGCVDGLHVSTAGTQSSPALSIDTAGADGVCVSFKTEACASGVAQGLALDLAAGGSAALGNWSAYLSLTKNGAGNVDIDADFTALMTGSAFVRVNVKQPDGTEHYDFAPQSSFQATVPGSACIKEIDWVVFNDIDSGFSILFEPATTITVYDAFGTLDYPVKRVWFAPEWPLGTGGGLILDEFQLTDGWAQTFVVESEFIQQYGLFHRALGDANIAVVATSPTTAVVEVAPLSANMQDGVEVALGQADSCLLAFEPIDPSGTAPAGATISLRAIGAVNGALGVDLGGVTLTKAGSSYAITADFTPIGSPTERVQVLNAGSLVVDLPGQGPAVGTASQLLIGGGKLGGSTECITTRYPNGTQFTVAGNAYVGDELRVLAEGSAVNIDYKSAFDVRAAGFARLRMTDATAQQQVLTANQLALSIGAGGTQYLHLDAGVASAGDTYFILGSASGTHPGLNIGFGAQLPLNLDAYLQFTAANPNSSIANSLGQLDNAGRATATLALPAGAISPALAGLQLHHAAILIDSATSARAATNAVTLLLVP